MSRTITATAGALFLVLTFTVPAVAQAGLAEWDDEALDVVESYFVEVEAMQGP